MMCDYSQLQCLFAIMNNNELYLLKFHNNNYDESRFENNNDSIHLLENKTMAKNYATDCK